MGLTEILGVSSFCFASLCLTVAATAATAAAAAAAAVIAVGARAAALRKDWRGLGIAVAAAASASRRNRQITDGTTDNRRPTFGLCLRLCFAVLLGFRSSFGFLLCSLNLLLVWKWRVRPLFKTTGFQDIVGEHR